MLKINGDMMNITIRDFRDTDLDKRLNFAIRNVFKDYFLRSELFKVEGFEVASVNFSEFHKGILTLELKKENSE